jgi:hypothetical protein
MLIDRVSRIGDRLILPENLVLGEVKWGEVMQTFDDNENAEEVEA